MAIAFAIQHLVFDAKDPTLVATFWSAVLGRPIADNWGDFVRLSPDESGVHLAFAAVTDIKGTKNRLHLDLSVADREDAVGELVDLGAFFVETRTQGDHSWTVMADPEGNEFCVGPA